MSKMKQATLFSLKSWKKIAVEEVLKYKEILDKKDVTEVVILATLVSLKKKNPTKDSVLSTGIDSSLKLLANHSNPRISSEVKMLLKHWKLESVSKYPSTIEASKENLHSKICDIDLDIKIEKVVERICKESKTLSPKKVESDLNVAKKQPINELGPTIVSTKSKETNQDEVSKPPSISQTFKAKSAKPVTKMQTPKQICKKDSIHQFRKSELTRRLQCAIQLFMEEVGKQEVRLYLDAQV